MMTSIVEGTAEDMKKYLSGFYSPVTTKVLGTAKRVGENMTKDNARQFIDDFMSQKQNARYRLVDERGKSAWELYEEFRILDVPMASGEVYCYSAAGWKLLVSKADESGIMLSFVDTK